MKSKLSEDERQTLLKPLTDAGWTLVEGRDAIYKQFMFKDFNQVIVTTGSILHSAQFICIVW